MDNVRVFVIILLSFVIGVLATILILSLIYFRSFNKYRKLNLAKVCDNCGNVFADYDVSDYVYCPSCGKKMREVNKEDLEEVIVKKEYCEKCNCHVEYFVQEHRYVLPYKDRYLKDEVDIVY